MLESFSRLSNEVLLHLYGYGCNDIIEKFKKTLGDRLIVHGKVSREETLEAMFNADILVNIGNSIPNQLPSKVFEYISMGKPVVNFAELKEDTSHRYFSKYPLALTVYNDQDIEKNLSLVEKFIFENKGKSLLFEEATANLKECLSENVVQRIVEAIDKVKD